MSDPLFTIITATYNAADHLPTLLGSLASQTCRNYELVLQDGNSEDHTVAIAESYRDGLPYLNMRSEPDTGIYDAWNRALDRASGQWMLFLGADDVLAGPDVLEAAAKKLCDAPPVVLYAAGDVQTVSPNGTFLGRIVGSVEGARQTLRTHMPFCHSGLFHRARLFNGQRFDIGFRVGSDYEFLCRTWSDDQVGMSLNLVVTHMRSDGLSSRPDSVWLVRREYTRIAGRHFRGIWTFNRMLGLAKGFAHHTVCKCFGTHRAPMVLDGFRRLRGLPPKWKASTGCEETPCCSCPPAGSKSNATSSD